MKKYKILIVALIVITLFLVVSCKNNGPQQAPECSEDQALQWNWDDNNDKVYECIPDPNGCHLLVEPGQLKNEECEEREDCYIPCHSSCFICEDIICGGCLPK